MTTFLVNFFVFKFDDSYYFYVSMNFPSNLFLLRVCAPALMLCVWTSSIR